MGSGKLEWISDLAWRFSIPVITVAVVSWAIFSGSKEAELWVGSQLTFVAWL